VKWIFTCDSAVKMMPLRRDGNGKLATNGLISARPNRSLMNRLKLVFTPVSVMAKASRLRNLSILKIFSCRLMFRLVQDCRSLGAT
jgi:hypothetical protein